MDSTGKYLVAAIYYGYIYYSTDFGATWSTSDAPSDEYWLSVTSSTTGQYVAASIGDVGRTYPGYVYLSTDYGQTWAVSNAASESYMSVVMNGDGGLVIGAAYDATIQLGDISYITTSPTRLPSIAPSRVPTVHPTTSTPTTAPTYTVTAVNQTFSPSIKPTLSPTVTPSFRPSRVPTYPVTAAPTLSSNNLWTASSSPTSCWNGIACSESGEIVAAVSGCEGDGVYLSYDYGVTWSQSSAPSDNFYSVAIDSSGEQIVAVVYNGGIYQSTDSGTSWSEINSLSGMEWYSIVCSSTGEYLLATSIGSTGSIYASAFAGSLWTKVSTSNQNYYSGAMSSYGEYAAVVVNGGQ